jgi:hypothetical protein
MPHPSGANVERVHYFLGIKDRDSLSRQTNADVVDAAKARMARRIEAISADRPPAGSLTTERGNATAPSGVRKASARIMRRAPGKTKSGGRAPSPLGDAIHSAVEASGRYEIHQPGRLYHHTLRTRDGGTVFAIERCTKTAIILWVPASPELADLIAVRGITVPQVSLPYPGGPAKYGRLSTLEQVPELAGACLFPVKVTTPGEALAVLELLP